MTKRFYLVPIEVVGDWRGPKYLPWSRDPDPENRVEAEWSGMDYGLMPVMLVLADVTDEQHATLSGYADVVAVPLVIDNLIGVAAVPAVQNALEGLLIPADWVDTSYTYRKILRGVAGLFQFAQRIHALYGVRIITSDYNLSTLIGALPINVRLNLTEAATSMGWDTSAIRLDWTVRRALMYLARQWGTSVFLFGDYEL